jgi:hypothetical protein
MFGAIGRMFAQKSVQRAVISTVIFLTLVVGGAYVMHDQAPLLNWLFRSSSTGAFANAGRPEQPTGGASLGADDPVKNFLKTGVGHVLFTAESSNNCRRTLFDNRTGETYDAGEVFCGQAPENVIEAQSTDRLMALRKPFNKR